MKNKKKTQPAQKAANFPQNTALPAASSAAKILTTAPPKYSFFDSRAFDYVILAAICLLIFFIRSKFFEMPMERDEGAYVLFGKQLLEGKTPYIDALDTRLPMLFYVYALVAFFGTTLKSTAVVFMFVEMLTTILLFEAARNLFNRTVAWVAALSLVLLAMNPSISGFTRQSEHFVSFFIVLGFYFLSKILKDESSKATKWQIFAMGMSFCAAMTVKHNAFFMVLYGGVFLLLNNAQNQPFFSKKLFTEIAYYAAGVLLVILVLFGSIAAMGATKEMWYWGFVHSGIYATTVSFDSEYFSNVMSSVTNNYAFFLYSAYAGLVMLAFIKKDWFFKANIWLFFVFSFLTVFPGFHFYGHYFLMWMPSVALFVGILYGVSQNLLANFMPRAVSLIVLIAFVFGFLIHLNKQKQFYFNPNYTAILKQTYGTNAFPEAVEIANQIKPEIKAGEYMGIVGSEQEMFLYTNTKPASRHTFAYHLMVDTTISANPVKWQKEYIAETEKNKPKFMLFFRQSTSLLATQKSSQTMFRWADKYLQENYNLYGIVDIFPDQPTQYIWGKDALTYKQKFDNTVLIFKRKGT